MIIIKNIERYNEKDFYEQSIIIIIEDKTHSKDIFIPLIQVSGLIEFMSKQDFKIYIKTDIELLKGENTIYSSSRNLSYEIFFKKEEHYQSFINDYVVLEKLAK